MIFRKYNTHVKIVSDVLKCETILQSDLFQLDEKWYIKILLSNNILNTIADIDNKCLMYAQKQGYIYRSCIYENTLLIKIPYRYKRFEAKCENCSFYELKRNHKVDIEFEAVSISNIKESNYTCCFKLKNLKLCFSRKHSHAPLESEEDA